MRRHSSLLIFNFQMMTALKNVFTSMQRLAAGLEQVVVDQRDRGGNFQGGFIDAYFSQKAKYLSLIQG